MSSLTPDGRKRGDVQRKRKAVRASTEARLSEGEVEDSSMHAQSQASCRTKRSPRSQDLQRNVVFNINGDVNINGDRFLNQQERRRPVTRSRPKQTPRNAARCDAPEDLSPESEGSMSSFDDDESEYNPPTRSKRPMNQRNEQQISERRAPKRYQPDEGYHTSSTAYRAEVNKRPPKGKAKEGTIPSRTSNEPLRSTKQAAPGDQKRPGSAGDSLVGPSGTRSDVELNECSEKEDNTEEAEADSGASEDDQTNIARDDHEGDNSEASDDQDESDDDFRLAIQISGTGDQEAEAFDVIAVLDTGTKPDWISQKYYEKLKKIGIKSVKLTIEEETRTFKDFQNKPFSATGKVCLVVHSDDFPGKNKSRSLTFFISKRSGFDVLIGKDTIKKQRLFERSKPDTDLEGEGAHVGLHGPISKAEEAETKKRKEKQQKRQDERKKEQDEKNEEFIKTKSSAKAPRSGNDSAHLATMVIRARRNRSPPRGGNDVARQQLERKSSSSLEGAW